jgi:hypothetical protein
MTVLLATMMEHARQIIQAILTIIGATFIGAFAIGFLGNYISQTLTSKKLNPTFLRFVRILGGLSTGFVVSMFVFNGSGGWGLGGGSGSGPGTGVNSAEKLVAGPPQGKTSNPPSPAIGVTVLGGTRVANEKFYLIDGQSNPKTLFDLQQMVKSAQTTDPGHLTLRIYDDSVAQDHPAVALLENWLRDQKWRVTIEKIPGMLPLPAGEKS